MPRNLVVETAIFLLDLSLLVLILGLVQGRDNFGNGKRDGKQTSKHALNEEAAFLVLFVFHVLSVLLEVHLVVAGLCPSIPLLLFLLVVSPPHHVDAALYDRFDEACTLSYHDHGHNVIEDDEVAENG